MSADAASGLDDGRSSIESLSDRISRAKLVSFDLFDTLLARSVAEPPDVFRLVTAKLITGPVALSHPQAVRSFAELRLLAETRARSEQISRSGHDEVTLDQIYHNLCCLAALPREIADAIKRAELATENDVIYANPVGIAAYHKALESQKHILICTDTYLPRLFIEDLLHKAGLAGWASLYLSCERQCNKFSGQLFQLITQERGVAESNILHIGDNAHSDVAMAERAGWRAAHLPFPPVPIRPWANEADRSLPILSIIGGLLRKRQLTSDQRESVPLEDLGFEIFGPLFTGFLLWITQAIARTRPSRVLLMARDMKWLLDLLPESLARHSVGEVTDVTYVYMSRGALIVAGLSDFPLTRLPHLFSGRLRKSVGNHLARLGLRPIRFESEIRAAGFSSSDELVENGDDRMVALLAAIHQPLLAEGLKRRGLASDYVAQCVGDAEEVMVVDVGWVGNIQASLVRLLELSHPTVSLTGCYVGLFRAPAENSEADHPMRSWLVRPGDPDAVAATIWGVGGVELIELAMKAAHGSTLAYERADDGCVTPVLEESDEERGTAVLSSALQRGAMRFVREFTHHFGSIYPEGLNSRAWGIPFARLVAAPTLAEAELLGDATHSDAAGRTDYRSPLAAKVDDQTERLEALRLAYWPAAFRVRNGLDAEFDEPSYLEMNPDVAEAVAGGVFENAYEHWLQYGRTEKRRASWAEWARTVGEDRHG